MIVIKDALGETVKNARNALGMKQGQLAESLGVSERYIMRLENGYSKPSFVLLCKIIRKLSIQSDMIFYPTTPVQRFPDRRPRPYAFGLR